MISGSYTSRPPGVGTTTTCTVLLCLFLVALLCVGNSCTVYRPVRKLKAEGFEFVTLE